MNTKRNSGCLLFRGRLAAFGTVSEAAPYRSNVNYTDAQEFLNWTQKIAKDIAMHIVAYVTAQNQRCTHLSKLTVNALN